jgi:hypothetical protein
MFIDQLNLFVSLAALAVSLVSLFVAVWFTRRSFRPIVTANVETRAGGNVTIAYDLVLLNSGTLPARNITVVAFNDTVERALGIDSGPANRRRWLACFEPKTKVSVLHNGKSTKCSFGTTQGSDAGFWKYRAEIRIWIQYEGWFGSHYKEEQIIQILDSESFTGFMWAPREASQETPSK